MSLVAKLYKSVFQRSSTYALAIITGAFFFERSFDLVADGIWNEMNKGVIS